MAKPGVSPSREGVWADVRAVTLSHRGAGQRILWGFCRTAILYTSRFSPMMNRFFPANFPNKQYQLLFTQGSGESKEGMLACWSLWGPECFLPLLFCFLLTRCFDFQPVETTFSKTDLLLPTALL